jgi:potassium efflux system protein
LLWVAGGHVVVRNLGSLFENLVFPMMTSKDRGSRFVWLALSRYAVIVIAYSAAFLTLGFSFANLGFAFAAVSVGIGFGLQEVIANFISGLILLFERPIRVGDVITVGQTGGTVDKIAIRATTVTNWDRQTIIIPNKNFITQNLTNWTHHDEVIRGVIQTRVAFGSDVEKVLEILDGVVREHPKQLETPPHRIWFDGFGETSLDFTVWAFTSLDDRISTRSAIQRRIHQRFVEEGIKVPIPRRELHVSADADSAGLAGMLEKREEESE